jgi:hypothetical protein
MVIATSGDVATTVHRFDDSGHGRAYDAMRARIFWVRRRDVDRFPSRHPFGVRIVVNVPIANRGDRTPELIEVFRF